MTHYTKEDRQYFEQLELNNRLLKAQQALDYKKLNEIYGEEIDATESKLLSRCTEFLRKNHYKYFHDYSKKINEAGILDLYIFLPKKRLVVIELKVGKGRLSKEQKEWISYLLYHGYEVYPMVKFYKRFLEIIYS